ncbi:MAG TPA: pilus assembly protein TadG-related protein [Acidimicrobiia bacterium]|nr:pilus assembly protein TadG-related protein [Acidimicrobiia bacterium]
MGFFRLRRRAQDERGTVLVVVALAMVVMIGSTALAVDIGQMTSKNRTLQAVADSVALDAARTLGGQNIGSLSAAGGPFMNALAESATRNNFSVSNLTVQFGTMNPNWTLMTNSSDVPTAVRVTANGSTKFAFRPGTASSTRSGTATMQNLAGFSIGSYLASIPAGGDGILNALFGDAFHLNAVSYTGLVNANLTLEEIGLNMPVSVLSPTELLSTSVGIRDFMLASIAALNAKGNTAAASVLNAMILNASLTGSVKLGDVITVVSGGETAAAEAALDVLQLITASAFVIEKNSGHALSIPTTSVSIPGIASITASATVIEPAKWIFGPVGSSISTAQVRLSVNPVINISTSNQNTPCNLTLSNLLGLVGCLLYLTGMPVGVTLSGAFPIDVTAAGATGTLAAINCSGTPGITVNTVTQAVNLNTTANLNLNVRLAGTNLLNAARVTIGAGAKTTPGSYATSFLSPSEFGPSHAKSVGSSALGFNGLLNVTTANVSVLNASLLSGVTSGLIQGLAVPVLNTLLTSLDNALIVPLTKVLGVKLGGADVAALGMACGGLRLVE